MAGAIADMENNYFPDVRHVGQGVWEYWIHSGPGIRVYYAREGDQVVILLAGGTKNTRRGQQNDIARARTRWRESLHALRNGKPDVAEHILREYLEVPDLAVREAMASSITEVG